MWHSGNDLCSWSRLQAYKELSLGCNSNSTTKQRGTISQKDKKKGGSVSVHARHIKEPYLSMARVPDSILNLQLPEGLCAITYMTKVSLTVILSITETNKQSKM